MWAQLHAAGSNLAVCLRAGPKTLGTGNRRVKDVRNRAVERCFARYLLIGDSDFGAVKPRFLEMAT